MSCGAERQPERKESLVVVRAAGILVKRETKQGAEFLLGRRRTRLEEGRFSPPGGKQEEGENLLRCAVRELEEETGLSIEPTDLVLICGGEQRFLKTGAIFDYEGFLVTWRPEMEEPQNLESEKHGPWEWLRREEMEDFLARDELSASAELMWKGFLRYEDYRLGLISGDCFESLREDMARARLLEEVFPERFREEKLLFRISREYL